MPVYATAADFVAYFGTAEAIELTNLEDPNATTVSSAILTANLELASAEIDDYLLPAQRVPSANFKRMTLEITRYKLDRNRQREDVRQRYEDVIKRLEAIEEESRSGDGDLPQLADDTYTTTIAYGVNPATALPATYANSIQLF